MAIECNVRLFENNSPVKYGCLMLVIPVSNWDIIQSSVPDDEIYDAEGRENEPHITILYGFKDNVRAHNVFIRPVTFTLINISIFETPEYDVLKYGIQSYDIEFLHMMNKSLPVELGKPFSPHLTIAYLKKGYGAKYVRPITPETGKSRLFRFADCNKNETKLTA